MGRGESIPEGSALSELLDLGAGAIAGVVKDNFDIAGRQTTLGSPAFSSAQLATRHAETVERLIAGGCRIVGRAKMHELAFGVSGINDWQGTALNPLYPSLIPGGSSSGSAAAVASGSVDFALGTDTGGSIREPAACCGVIGFKPTFGRVSRDGVHPAVSSLDCVGVFARNVAVIDQIMAMIDPGFVGAGRVPINAIGLVSTDVDPDVGVAFSEAISATGLPTLTIDLAGMRNAFHAGITIIGAEMWHAFGGDVEAMDAMGSEVRDRLCAAASITPQEVAEAETVRTRFTTEVDRVLETVDVLALPTLPQVPPTLARAARGDNLLWLTANVRPFNVSGHPAITLPIITANGLPAGLQLIGRKRDDARLCAMARQIAQTFSHRERQTA